MEGKEIPMKAVIQAIPSYVMNCFLLPVSTCHDLEKEIARFYWGASTDVCKCHWVSWDGLSKPKVEGGLGLNELYCFNPAMLAKQLWRLLHNPDSMIYKILQAKYFPTCTILQAEYGHQPTFLWRSLLASRSLVEYGTC